jgi:reactive chlorine resistance protein C
MTSTTERRRTTTAMNEGSIDSSSTVQMAAAYLLRYGLVLVIAWIGFMKFTAYEAAGIQPLVSHSPLMRWVYDIFSERAFSALLGVVEIAIAAMIAWRPVSAKVAAIGSGLAVMMFLTTLSFLFSTPGWEPSLGGFPGLSALPGQFLLKDVVLLGAALWSLGEALQAIERGRAIGVVPKQTLTDTLQALL